MIPHKPFIAGHSHVKTLGCPFVDGGLEPADLLDSRFQCIPGPWPRDLAYSDALIEHAGGRVVFLFWSGNQHLIDFMLQPDPPFDFEVASRPDLALDQTVEQIPESAMQDRFADLGGLEQMLSRLTAAGALPVVCGTPPPKRDNAFLARVFERENAWDVALRARGLEFNISVLSSPYLRLKLWIVVQGRMAAAARAAGCAFSPVPRTLQDLEGFLAQEFWGEDLSHAGGDYGTRMRDHLYATFIEPASVTCIPTPTLPPDRSGHVPSFATSMSEPSFKQRLRWLFGAKR